MSCGQHFDPDRKMKKGCTRSKARPDLKLTDPNVLSILPLVYLLPTNAEPATEHTQWWAGARVTPIGDPIAPQ